MRPLLIKTIMEILLVRNNSSKWGIDGHLYINRQRICDTVEHPTCHLPGGEYIIPSLGAEGSSLSETAHSERHAVPQPFRHGDGALALKHGEIIVGTYAIPGVVTQSQPIYDRLYERLKKAFQRGTPVHLKIV